MKKRACVGPLFLRLCRSGPIRHASLAGDISNIKVSLLSLANLRHVIEEQEWQIHCD